LSIPLQKVCKETEKGESTCNKEILDQLQKFRSNPNEIPNNKIWKDLDKFKDLGE
jgi:Mn-dependent DtxR family transcriptional regulator